ncbi:MAG TPA: Hsp20/alpha crystallin family protein [Deltaproteobacteria bacterium]|nr:Hsp20/alpha crystallin family protein [Deltaproteobacteria bacterium]
MAIEKWTPLKELETMRREMDRIWEELFTGGQRHRGRLAPQRAAAEGVAAPALDIIDKDDEILVKVEMPGVAKEDIDVSVENNVLTVKGEIRRSEEEKDDAYYHVERTYKSYARSIGLPVEINPEKIKAGLKDGILYIHLGKSEAVKPKRIKVEVE